MVTLSDPSNNELSLTIAARNFQLRERNCLEFPFRVAPSAKKYADWNQNALRNLCHHSSKSKPNFSRSIVNDLLDRHESNESTNGSLYSPARWISSEYICLLWPRSRLWIDNDHGYMESRRSRTISTCNVLLLITGTFPHRNVREFRKFRNQLTFVRQLSSTNLQTFLASSKYEALNIENVWLSRDGLEQKRGCEENRWTIK